MRKSMGRSRNAEIDVKVLAAARRHLSVHGFEAMSLAAIADEAGTTRQALYRRWPTKAALAADVVGALEQYGDFVRTQDPFLDLVTELVDFQRGVSRSGRLSLVGTMLQETTDAEVATRYRSRIVAPRRARLRGILERARDSGLIDADADLEVAITMCTGSWYARALAGLPAPERWPERTAALVWRAVGGHVPKEDSVIRKRIVSQGDESDYL